jgi:phage shock protein PspC (stress-responsive transcriptional regulator)
MMANQNAAGTGWFGRFVAEIDEALRVPKGKGRLVRPRYPRKIAGVCAGLAEHYDWNATWVRVAALALIPATSGMIVLVYGAAWVLIPEGDYALTETAGSTRI